MHATTATTAKEQGNSVITHDRHSFNLTNLRSTPKDLIHLPGQSLSTKFLLKNSFPLSGRSLLILQYYDNLTEIDLTVLQTKLAHKTCEGPKLSLPSVGTFSKAGLCRVNKSQNLGKKPSDRSREPITAKTVSKNNHSV